MQSNGNVKTSDYLMEEEVHDKIFIGIDPGKNGGAAVINEKVNEEPTITPVNSFVLTSLSRESCGRGDTSTEHPPVLS